MADAIATSSFDSSNSSVSSNSVSPPPSVSSNSVSPSSLSGLQTADIIIIPLGLADTASPYPDVYSSSLSSEKPVSSCNCGINPTDTYTETESNYTSLICFIIFMSILFYIIFNMNNRP